MGLVCKLSGVFNEEKKRATPTTTLLGHDNILRGGVKVLSLEISQTRDRYGIANMLKLDAPPRLART